MKTTASEETIRVLMFPSAINNPYQTLLAQALERDGARVVISTLRSLPSDFWRLRPQVVHVHWVEAVFLASSFPGSILRFVCTIPLFLLMKLVGTRITWTVHNLQCHRKKFPRMNAFTNRVFGRMASSIICFSEFSAAAVVREGIAAPAKIRIVPHGNYIRAYSNEISRGEARLRLGIASHARVFLFCGRIEEYKGILELIRAFKALPDGDAVLLVAGASSSPALLGEVLRESAGDARIRINPGFVPPGELQVYFNACDAAVYPYQDILNSGSVWLAMSFGVCCIVPALGSIPETLDSGSGVLLAPGDCDALLNALRFGARNPEELARRGRSALIRARGADWASIARSTLEAYRGALPSVPLRSEKPVASPEHRLRKTSVASARSTSGLESRYLRFFSSPEIRKFLNRGGKVFIATENRSEREIETLLSLGHRRFSEKYAQEVARKWQRPALDDALELHFFGTLQRNKAGVVTRSCDAIESIDRESLALRLAQFQGPEFRARRLYVQVNVDEEPQKGGVSPLQAGDLIRFCAEEAKLPIRGLMAIPKKGGDCARSFEWLRKLADRHGLEECIMGMSDDYSIAIAKGATAIRVGRAIFKERSANGETSLSLHGPSLARAEFDAHL